MANIREAFEYAARNPNSDFARNLKQQAASGALDVEAKKFGLDLTPLKPAPEPAKRSVPEKITDFTGGKEIAQGLGQALANPKINKQIEQTQQQQFDIQGQLLKRIKEDKALGKDTSRLEQAAGLLAQDISQTGQETGQLLNQKNLTGKQVVGDALQLATTAGGAKVAGAVAGKATQAAGVGAGIIQGVKTGAIAGTALGGLTGVSQGLQENKDAKGIAKSALTGSVSGAIGGGILGGLTGGIAGGIKARALKKDGFVVDLVSPKATEKVKIQALKEGRVSEQGLLNAAKIQPSKRDIQLADAVKDVVSSKKSATQNLTAIENKVDDINTGVKAYVKSNKVPFNTSQLKKQLNDGKEELNLVFASDKQAEKTYDAVVKEFMKHVKNKDTAGLFEARQKFDSIPAIKKLLDSQGLGENTKKGVVLTVRGMANKYVASLLPKGNQFRDTLLRESKMIEALQNIAEKNTGIIGANKLQSLTQKYPLLKSIVGGIAAGAGLGAVGVGSSVISSSD